MIHVPRYNLNAIYHALFQTGHCKSVKGLQPFIKTKKMYIDLKEEKNTLLSTLFSWSCVSPSVDCAGIVLNCLFCRFYDMIHMLPDSCKGLANHCCPSYKHVITTAEAASSSDDDSYIDLDCGVFGSCHDASDCLELAMEVSEICYH